MKNDFDLTPLINKGVKKNINRNKTYLFHEFSYI